MIVIRKLSNYLLYIYYFFFLKIDQNPIGTYNITSIVPTKNKFRTNQIIVNVLKTGIVHLKKYKY